jgi:magnesium transporter
LEATVNIGIRRRKKAGTPPGTLVYTGTNEARPTRITVTEYDQGTIREYAPESAKECSRVLTSSLVNWINVDGLHDAAVLTEMGQVFGIHPLALEDIANTQQRARVQVFENHLFIVLKMLYPDPDLEAPEALLEEQISLVVGPNYVITFQEHPGDPFDPIRRRLQTGAGRIRRMGADYLAYALLDTIVDNYFLVLEQLGDHLIALETGVIESGDHSHLQKVYRAKHTLIALRRHIWPLREMVSALVRGDASNGEGPSLIGETTTLYIRDVYDHVIQIIDILESYRDMVSALVDLHISNQSNRMNEVMKVLTIIATIFIPLTFIAGIYGMNFDPAASPFNMPELAWYWGYPTSLLAMAAIAGGMLYFFRKKGWL